MDWKGWMLLVWHGFEEKVIFEMRKCCLQHVEMCLFYLFFCILLRLYVLLLIVKLMYVFGYVCGERRRRFGIFVFWVCFGPFFFYFQKQMNQWTRFNIEQQFLQRINFSGVLCMEAGWLLKTWLNNSLQRDDTEKEHSNEKFMLCVAFYHNWSSSNTWQT